MMMTLRKIVKSTSLNRIRKMSRGTNWLRIRMRMEGFIRIVKYDVPTIEAGPELIER